MDDRVAAVVDPRKAHQTDQSVSFGEIVYPLKSTLGPRIQRSIQIVIVYRGSVAVWIDDYLTGVAAGAALLLLPGHREYFAFSNTTETQHSWVHLPADWYSDPFMDRLMVLPRVLRLSRTLAGRMRALLDIETSMLPTRRDLESLLASLVLLQFVGEAELLDGRWKSPPPSPFASALEVIDERLGSALQLDELAASVAVSKSHLMRLFHQHLGTTPARYLWQRRVEHGIELLEETGLPIGEIARRCGFTTSHHFSRKVRDATGASPTAVRQKAWGRTPTPDQAWWVCGE
jgi:AraC-like DNA-binding protein